MLGLVAAGPGCRGLTFACADDAQCGADGTCELAGWCSFSDTSCESGRRYADASGDGLGGACVEQPSGTSTSSEPAGGPTSGLSSSGSEGESTGSPTTASIDSATATATTTSTTGPDATSGPSSSTTTPVAESSTGGEETSSEETTGVLPEECVGYTDHFDDGKIDPFWESYGPDEPNHALEEIESQLQWTLVEGVVEQLGIQRVLETTFGRARIHIVDVPSAPGGTAQVVLSVREYLGDEQYYFVWANGALDVRDGPVTLETLDPYEWLDVEYAPEGLIVSVSDDGVNFQPELTLDTGIDADDTWIVLYGQTWTSSSEASTGAVDFVQICEP